MSRASSISTTLKAAGFLYGNSWWTTSSRSRRASTRWAKSRGTSRRSIRTTVLPRMTMERLAL
eukprot:7626552-Pyramimonas_sp.AAC.1